MRSNRAGRAVDHAAHALGRAPDERLLELAAAGNSRAFEAIVERYRPALTRFCGSLTSAERVEDAVQQTFVSAWLAIDKGVLVRDLRPWLYRIARNAAIDQHRARGLGDGELPDELIGGIDPAHLTAGRTYFEDVLRAVSELPDRQRVALLETAVHGRSTESVANDLGVSGGALRQLVHRARVTVRTTVTSLGAGPLTNWLAQLGADDSGLRRVATVLGGAGSGTVAALSKTTAAVVSAGAIAAGGVVATSEHDGTKGRASASASAGSSAAGAGGGTGGVARGGSGAVGSRSGSGAASSTNAVSGTSALASASRTGAASAAAGSGSVAHGVTVSLPNASASGTGSGTSGSSGSGSKKRSKSTGAADDSGADASVGGGGSDDRGRSHTADAVSSAPSRDTAPVDRAVQSSITAPRGTAASCPPNAQPSTSQAAATPAATSSAPTTATASANDTGSSATAPSPAASATPTTPTDRMPPKRSAPSSPSTTSTVAEQPAAASAAATPSTAGSSVSSPSDASSTDTPPTSDAPKPS